jgi:glycosyltransferase involved in cell wall biosynthesis
MAGVPARRSSPRGLTITSFPNPFPGNPYLRLLYDHLALEGVGYVRSGYFGRESLWAQRGGVDLLHFHWPSQYYEDGLGRPSIARLAAFLLKLRWARRLGYRTVWTVHNLYPHDRGRGWKAWLCRFLVVHAMDLLLVHFEGARQDLWRVFRRRRGVRVVPHGNYRPVYPDLPGRAQARRALGIAEGSYVYLVFGGVRPYKGAHRAVRAFRELEGSDLALYVVGQCLDPAYGQVLECLAAGDGRVTLTMGPEDLPDEQVGQWLAASDCLVTPYREIHTSGVLFLAATFGKPIVAPRLGIFRELDGQAFVLAYDPAAEARLLPERMAAARAADPQRVRDAARGFADRHDWAAIARRLAEVLEATP